MWSDESTVQCVKMSGNRVRRPVTASRFYHRYTKKTVKHPDHVMVWGCFSGAVGRGGLYFLPHNVTMNSDRKMWFSDLDVDYFKKLSDSMAKRLQMVIDNKG
ncbi:putative Transposable element Tcb2 transposase-like 12 [Homarus americanus]|uniref:Putative Transposable element Tcb2 transposase-like 12 n=1 Tax=Homarus americanus TaxID=6706 RepID=A0A8J5JNS5_HOMAM|nr:putative Transposable element Tcb2 transposase-like 12 [Homarus americanus]